LTKTGTSAIIKSSKERKVTKMAIIEKRNEIIALYGADSEEAGWIQYVFSRRGTEEFEWAYNELKNNYKKG